MLGQFLPIEETTNVSWAQIPGIIKILSDDTSLETENSQFALFMAINSLTRLFPVITEIIIDIPDIPCLVIVPLFDGKTVKEAIQFFLESTSPKCEVLFKERNESHEVDFTLILGNHKEKNKSSVSIGSNGWISLISVDDSPTCFSSNINPIGAFTAAIIGGMEIFKHLFLKKMDIIEPSWSEYDIRHRLKFIEGSVIFSSFTYETATVEQPNPNLPDAIDVGDLFCIGLGAGGGAVIYTMASFQRNVNGNIILVDPDELKQSNMNRYIYSNKTDAYFERKKTDVTSELLQRYTNLNVEAFPVSYQLFSKKYTEKMDVVISTVDTKVSKQAIQWDIPRIIFDAGVIQTEFYLRRIDLGKSLCLVCLEKQTSEKTPEHLASEIIGLTTEEIIQLRSENAVITSEHIEKMEEKTIIHNFTLPKLGERFSDWWLDHCGEIAITKTQERIPLPFATILPGILIAGEIIKEKYFKDYSLENHYLYNMVSLPPYEQLFFKPKTDCALCSKEITIKIFRDRYS